MIQNQGAVPLIIAVVLLPIVVRIAMEIVEAVRHGRIRRQTPPVPASVEAPVTSGAAGVGDRPTFKGDDGKDWTIR
jgi:hypothetical protein